MILTSWFKNLNLKHKKQSYTRFRFSNRLPLRWRAFSPDHEFCPDLFRLSGSRADAHLSFCLLICLSPLNTMSDLCIGRTRVELNCNCVFISRAPVDAGTLGDSDRLSVGHVILANAHVLELHLSAIIYSPAPLWDQQVRHTFLGAIGRSGEIVLVIMVTLAVCTSWCTFASRETDRIVHSH